VTCFDGGVVKTLTGASPTGVALAIAKGRKGDLMQGFSEESNVTCDCAGTLCAEHPADHLCTLGRPKCKEIPWSGEECRGHSSLNVARKRKFSPQRK
jgi:hypothetical protein